MRTQNTEPPRLRRALERILAAADELGDLTGVPGLAEIARRALAGEDIAPEPTAPPQPGPLKPSYVLAAFIVTHDGERQHPMDVAVVKLHLHPDGNPDVSSMQDLTQRVTRAVLRKANEHAA